MRTTEVKLSTGRTITLTRPVFSQMPNVVGEYEALLQSEGPGDLMGDPAFLELLEKAFPAKEEFDTFMGDADHTEVWDAWEAYVEFARFESFLETASTRLAERRQRQMRRQLGAVQEQLEMMKQLGAVPKDLSIESFMQEQLGAAQNLSSLASQPGSATPKPKDATKK